MNEKQKAQKVADWLKSLKANIETVLPVRVKIGRKTYVGAWYMEAHQATGRIVDEGPMTEDDQVYSYQILLLGEKPKHRRAKNVYKYDGLSNPEPCYEHSDEWYIACWYPHDEPNEHNPFGRTFMLKLHQPMNFGYYQGWKIDTGDRYEPYARIPMDVEVFHEDD